MNNQHSYPGFFVALEGPEGSGKSTLCKNIKEYFDSKNIDAIFTREPGASQVEVCHEIRSLLLDHKGLDSRTEVLLFAANRSEHVTKLIIPSLEDKKIVVCDRYVDSSLAYQGFAREIGYEAVYNINQFATRNLVPDLTVFIDIQPEVGLDRIKSNRSNEMNHLDQESIDFHHKVYEGYKQIIAKNKERYVIINGNQPIENIFKEVIAAMNKKLKEGKYFYHEI